MTLQIVPGLLLLHLLFVGKGLGTFAQQVLNPWVSLKVRHHGKKKGHKDIRRQPNARLEGATELFYIFNLVWAVVAFVLWLLGFQGIFTDYGNALHEVIWTSPLVWVTIVLILLGFFSEFFPAWESALNKYTITGVVWAGYYFLFQLLAALTTSYVDSWLFWLIGVVLVAFSLLASTGED